MQSPPSGPVATRRRLLAGVGGVAASAAVLASPGARTAAASTVRCESRYLGYRAADQARPYAKYMKARVDPPQPQVGEAIARGPVAPAAIPTRSGLGADIHTEGYSPVETGFGRLANGEIWVACLTDMPGVEPHMWDWWFAWHSKESARYKLWHPEAHAYAALRQDRTDAQGLTDQQKYRSNTSYVDEVIGGRMDQLAISFTDPRRFGVDPSRFDGTAICGTVGTALVPVNVGILCHQVRRTEAGSEMRSRFYLNVAGTRGLDLTSVACAIKRGALLPSSITFDLRFGAALLRHCGEEMNHLAGFLPELYAEF
ncbi:MAG: hypothetical protein JHD16_04330, partial [Solirubrobacteraceae bacterium]|nr:hypothetical protein [Solirubrobacteraceae bacterium]